MFDVVATWWEPGSTGLDVGDTSAVLGFVLMLIFALMALGKFAMHRLQQIIRDEITAATRPIQRDANGGLSLPDVARRADWTREALIVLAGAQGVALPEFEEKK